MEAQPRRGASDDKSGQDSRPLLPATQPEHRNKIISDGSKLWQRGEAKL